MTSVNGNRRNERLYRALNRRIREIGEFVSADGAVELLCECGREDCTATLKFTAVQYDALLNQDDCVLLASDHAHVADGRRVLAENGRFVIVASD